MKDIPYGEFPGGVRTAVVIERYPLRGTIYAGGIRTEVVIERHPLRGISGGHTFGDCY